MTDHLERARELMVTLREASEELTTLYGPLYNAIHTASDQAEPHSTEAALTRWSDHDLGLRDSVPPEDQRRLVRAEQARREFLKQYDEDHD